MGWSDNLTSKPDTIKEKTNIYYNIKIKKLLYLSLSKNKIKTPYYYKQSFQRHEKPEKTYPILMADKGLKSLIDLSVSIRKISP